MLLRLHQHHCTRALPGLSAFLAPSSLALVQTVVKVSLAPEAGAAQPCSTAAAATDVYFPGRHAFAQVGWVWSSELAVAGCGIAVAGSSTAVSAQRQEPQADRSKPLHLPSSRAGAHFRAAPRRHRRGRWLGDDSGL